MERLKKIGTLEPIHSLDVKDESPMGLGMEKLDRDAFDPEKVYDKVAALGVKWIRILYCYPDKITDELITEFNENPKLVKYIDLPIQHISSKYSRAGRRPRGKRAFTILLGLTAKWIILSLADLSLGSAFAMETLFTMTLQSSITARSAVLP